MKKRFTMVFAVIVTVVVLAVCLSVVGLMRTTALDGWLLHAEDGSNLLITRSGDCISVVGNNSARALLQKHENGARIRLFSNGVVAESDPLQATAFGGFCYGRSALTDLPQSTLIALTDAGRIDGLGLYEIREGWLWKTSDDVLLLTADGSLTLKAARESEQELLAALHINDRLRCVCRKNEDGTVTLCKAEKTAEQTNVPEAYLKQLLSR